MLGIVLEIKSSYENLDPSEKKVADFIILKFPFIPYTSISTLAEEVKTSKTTINRFCKKMGYSGYKDFKVRILKETLLSSSELFSGTDVPLEKIDKTNILKVLSFVIKSNISTLIETKNLLAPEIINQAVETLIQSSKTYLVGIGSSIPVVIDAEHRFNRLGINCYACTDPHFQIVRCINLSSSDTIIGISHSGYSKDVFNTLQIAKSKRAKIISITSSPYSPIAKIADYLLPNATRKAPFLSESISSRISQMAIIDILSSIIYLRKSEKLENSLIEIENLLASKRLDDF